MKQIIIGLGVIVTGSVFAYQGLWMWKTGESGPFWAGSSGHMERPMKHIAVIFGIAGIFLVVKGIQTLFR